MTLGFGVRSNSAQSNMKIAFVRSVRPDSIVFGNKTKGESEGQQSQPARNGGSSGSRGGFSTKKTPYARPSFSSGSKGSSYQPSVQSGSAGPSGTVKCFKCGGPHYPSNCPMGRRAVKCFKCGKEGHFADECTSAVGLGSQAQKTNLPSPREGGRPPTMGRVYALVGSEAVSSGNLIICICLLLGVPCVVLFNSGTAHSFRAKACVEKLGMSVEELGVDLVVSTPTSGLIRMYSVCAIVVEGRRFKVNLVCLSLPRLEVILEIDWLSTDRILVDCGNKEMLFPDEDE
ncbi:uncharacterized protein LOC128194372 [Vigna angularis]|uniref:uncharacterized protein LOC128194372 n=1 Tax=Phaseolus angularis TaxID=3914 RepID=UPI0022B2D683|nr:uncharacterized protein LOC128194372 [Vigna angularis]